MTVYRRPDPIPMHRAHPVASVELGQIRPDQQDLHHLVARRIFLAISSGAYPEGSILPTEQALSDELGVSRTALREAIKGLASKGLLETRRRRGTMVLERSHWNMLDAEMLTWLRRDDSGAVSEQLWQTIVALLPSLGGLAALRHAPTPMRNSRLAAGEASLGARAEFILEIARTAGNRFTLSIVAGALNNLIADDRSFLELATGGLTPAAASAIASAIIASDNNAAETNLRAALSSQGATVPA